MVPPVSDHWLFPSRCCWKGSSATGHSTCTLAGPTGAPAPPSTSPAPSTCPGLRKVMMTHSGAGSQGRAMPGTGRGSWGFPSCPLPGETDPWADLGSGDTWARSRASSRLPWKRVFGAEHGLAPGEGFGGAPRGTRWCFVSAVKHGLVSRRCGADGQWVMANGSQPWRDYSQCEEETEDTAEEVGCPDATAGQDGQRHPSHAGGCCPAGLTGAVLACRRVPTG